MEVYKLIGLLGISLGALMIIYAIYKVTTELHRDTKKLIRE